VRVFYSTVPAAALLIFSSIPTAQVINPSPRVELTFAPPLRLPGDVDSNSPAIWDRTGGRNQLFVMTSMSGRPNIARGTDLSLLAEPQAVAVTPWPGGGVWMEAVVADVEGTWYGYYHNETVAQICRTEVKAIPRIGAARSRDRGLTWESLGVILEAPPRTFDCTTNNRYFVGGVGDLSVQLDPASRDLYLFFSTYLRQGRLQGVAVARLAWADRDTPKGRIMVWQGGIWVPASSMSLGRMERWIYPAATPVFKTTETWHDDDSKVNAYWGPSVHWNSYLRQYVMLLNRAKDEAFQQEGIYVSFAPSLADPPGPLVGAGQDPQRRKVVPAGHRPRRGIRHG
jgi:hypothetical protein